MVRTPKLRLLREKKRAALQEIAQLEATIAELRSLVSDYDITERVLSSLSDGDDDDIQDETGIEAKTEQVIITSEEEVERKKPRGIPTVPQMIYESLRDAADFGATGLEPAAMLEFVRKKYWPAALSPDIGSTAWRLWKARKLKKSGSIYSLPDEQEKKTQDAA
jgi:hypothetical protein